MQCKFPNGLRAAVEAHKSSRVSGVKCLKCFDISYALILQDEEGKRAAQIGEEANLEVP